MNQNNWKKKVTRFLTAQTISLFGSSLVQYAIIWYITISTSSGVMMTIATLCGYLPQIAISLFAGAWVDRYNRKIVSMTADAVIAISTLAIALSFMAGYKSTWLLFAVLIVRSAGTGIQTPAVNALIPQMVPKEHLMRINGINSTLQSLMMFLSPALSGAILTFIKIEATFFIDVITAVIGIGIMFTISIPNIQQEKSEHKTSILHDVKLGLIYLKEHRYIMNRIIFLIAVMILISPSAFLTPLMVTRTFGADVWRLTVSEMTFSLGAVAGGILISSWGGFKNKMNTIVFATLLYGGMMIGLGSAPFYIIYLVFNFLIGISMPCFNTPVNVLLQEEVEPDMHGRVFSIVQIANACALPLGTLIFGPLADTIRIQTLLICSGTVVMIIGIIVWKGKRFTKEDYLANS